MNKIVFFLTVFTINLSISQESFTMVYGCLRVIEPINSKLKNDSKSNDRNAYLDTDIKVEFSVGIDKDIVIHSGSSKKLFKRIGTTSMNESSDGVRFQSTKVVNSGNVFIFQYYEDFDLRLVSEATKKVIEYSCSEEIQEDSDIMLSENIELNYYVTSERAYFYDTPDFNTKRKAFLIKGDVIMPIVEKNNFIYIKYDNDKGKSTVGWISKKDILSF